MCRPIWGCLKTRRSSSGEPWVADRGESATGSPPDDDDDDDGDDADVTVAVAVLILSIYFFFRLYGSHRNNASAPAPMFCLTHGCIIPLCLINAQMITWWPSIFKWTGEAAAVTSQSAIRSRPALFRWITPDFYVALSGRDEIVNCSELQTKSCCSSLSKSRCLFKCKHVYHSDW